MFLKVFVRLASFRRDERGAVTVDWVVLTAGVVLLALGAVTGLREAIDSVVNSTSGMVAGFADRVADATL